MSVLRKIKSFSSGFILHFQAWPSVGFLLPPVMTFDQRTLESNSRLKSRKESRPFNKQCVNKVKWNESNASGKGSELDVNNSMMALTVFKCKICGKNFKKKEYLRDHLNIHAGRKCYACNYCGESFVHRASMARHRLKCHLAPSNQAPIEGTDEVL